MADQKDVRLYWDHDSSTWGPPNAKNYDAAGVDWDATAGAPTADYNTRFNMYNGTASVSKHKYA